MSFAKVIFFSIFQPLRKFKQETIMELMKLIVRVFIGIFIFLNTFHYATSVEETCFYVSFLIAIILATSHKIDFSFESPLTLPFVFFVSWAMINLFFALNKENSIIDIYGHLLKNLVFYYILINFFNSRSRLVSLAWYFVISAAAYSIAFMVYFYLVLGNSLSILFRIHPYLDYLYVFAFLLSLQLLSGETKIMNRIALLVCLIGTAGATILTQTRTALLAIIISLIILFMKNKKVMGFFVILFLLPFVLSPYFGNRLTMSAIWDHKNIRIGTTFLFIEMIKDYPITGIGFGLQTYDDPKLLAIYNNKVPPEFKQDPPIASPHNLFTDVAVRLGLVGLALLIYILFIFIRMGRKLMRPRNDVFIRKWTLCLSAGFVAFFIQAMFSDATFGIQAIVFYTLLAMMTILWRMNPQPDRPREAKRTP